MAKVKKTKEAIIETQSEKIEPIGEIKLTEPKKIENCEWCFQFDDDEAQVFAWTDELLNYEEEPKVVFTISNLENSYITFQNAQSGKTFKIFARELSETGKQLRDKQREALKNFNADVENFDEKMNDYASENKETQA